MNELNVFKNTAWIRRERQKWVKSKGQSDAAAAQLPWLRDNNSPHRLLEILKTKACCKELSSRAGCCLQLSVSECFSAHPPYMCVCACGFVYRPSDLPHLLPDCFIQIHPNSFGRGFTFSNMTGVVPVIGGVQVFLSFPLIPPVILFAGQRSMNRNEMFQRDLWEIVCAFASVCVHVRLLWVDG